MLEVHSKTHVMTWIGRLVGHSVGSGQGNHLIVCG